MKITKPEYEYKIINSRDICIDKLYQRELDARRVAKIAKDFDPYLVNPCKVSYRGGKYWCFDGQHTISALKTRNGNRDVPVECKVFYGLTRIEEAELFVKQNGLSRAVSVNARFRALLNTGDPDVTAMNRAVESVGLKLSFANAHSRNNICALSTLFKAFSTLPDSQFRDMLAMMKEAWGGQYESFTTEMISGMQKFYATYAGRFNRRNLVRRLARRSPVEIVRDGKVSSTGGSTRFARVILNIYNTGTTTGRLPDEL